MINKYFLVSADAIQRNNGEEKKVRITFDELGISSRSYGYDIDGLVRRNLFENGVYLGDSRYAVLRDGELVNIEIIETHEEEITDLKEQFVRFKKTIVNHLNHDNGSKWAVISYYEDMYKAEGLSRVNDIDTSAHIERYISDYYNGLEDLGISIEDVEEEKKYLKLYRCSKSFRIDATFNIVAEDEDDAYDKLSDLELNEYNLCFDSYSVDTEDEDFYVDSYGSEVEECINEEYELIEE